MTDKASDKATEATGVPDGVALFELPEYDEAFRTFLSKAMNGLAAAKDPMLARVPRVKTRRMYRGQNSIGAADKVETPLMSTRNTFGFSHEVVVDCDIEGVGGELDAAAERYVAAVMPQVFANLSLITTAFGNTHDVGWKPFTWDMFLDILDGMEVAFDRDDNPIVPTLVVGLGFQAPKMTPEQQSRMGAILDAKRATHLAGRRSRQLPRNPLGG